MLAAQHELHVVESLLCQQRQCFFRHLYNRFAFKFGGAHTLFRQQSVLGFVFTQLKHGCVLKFRFCCHSYMCIFTYDLEWFFVKFVRMDSTTYHATMTAMPAMPKMASSGRHDSRNA